MLKKLPGLLALICCFSLSQAKTIAWFADPSRSPAAPDIVLYQAPTGQQILGLWNWDGPYLMPITLNVDPHKAVYNNIFMSMPLTNIGGAGTIDFTDTLGNPVLHIEFDKGVFLNGGAGFGASPATGSHVFISGPGLRTYKNAYFAFTFDRGGRLSMTSVGIDASFTCGY